MTRLHMHATHPALVALLKHADRHLCAVTDMIEAGNPCLEIVKQMQAAEKALVNTMRVLIHDHMDHCLDAGHSAADRDEQKAISGYF